MRASRLATLAIASLALLMPACDAAGVYSITAPAAPVGPQALVIVGLVRSAADSTPVNEVRLEVYEITSAGTPDIRVASTRSSPSGGYSLWFSGRCDRQYGLKVVFPHVLVRCSRCPIWPLPSDGCNGVWVVNLWVAG